MILKKTWNASIKQSELENKSLQYLEGKWKIGVNVEITNPFSITNGPIEISINEEERLPIPSK